MTMGRDWQDALRHKITAFAAGPFDKGKVGVDSIHLYAAKTPTSKITFNLGHIRGDRASILRETVRIITSAAYFFSPKYQGLVIVGFFPEELPILKQEGWKETPSRPLVALQAEKQIDRSPVSIPLE
jgi:hypothetical protein